ncbi:MAG: hypothetical protein KGI97_06985 [Alphaproteobacteria bacterium]|nr:hypothetical protein [Alphaproteobacteria bacterium]
MRGNNANLLLKFLSPRLVAKAVATLDKSTAIVVGICWGVAMTTLVVTLITVHAAIDERKAADEAIVAEPILPVAKTVKIVPAEVRKLIDQMTRQFPDVKFEATNGGSMIIRGGDGNKFHEWISALSYIDTISPQYRWLLDSFCVGHCTGQDVMRAEVSGQKVTFSLPEK